MQQRRRFTVFAVAVVLATVIVVTIKLASPGFKPPSLKSGSVDRQIAANSFSKEPTISPPTASKNSPDLEFLKRKWLDYHKVNPENYITTDVHLALAKESVSLLLCTEETVALIEFLEKNNFPGDGLISQAVASLLTSERAAEARKALISMSIVTQATQQQSLGKERNYRERWSFYAGRGCPEIEFADFCAALRDESCVQSAIFGRNLAAASVDPESAISNTLHAIHRNVFSSHQNEILKQILEELPPDVNFSQIEKLFPPVVAGADPLDPVSLGRDGLLKKWASADALGAVNYVLSVPERLGPKEVAVISAEVAKSNPGAGVTLAQEFPDGLYYDAAVGSLMPYISGSFPTQSRELASRIQDPEIRKTSFRVITEQEARNARRAAGGGAK